MTGPGSRATAGATQRCPLCQRLNRVPPGGAGGARCGACRAPLGPLAAASPPPRSGDLGRLVVERWDALLGVVPPGLALGRAVGRSGSGTHPATDPVGWLSNASHTSRDDLEQVRLLRIHLASNKTAPPDLLTRALDTLDRAEAALARAGPPGLGAPGGPDAVKGLPTWQPPPPFGPQGPGGPVLPGQLGSPNR